MYINKYTFIYVWVNGFDFKVRGVRVRGYLAYGYS
jgi:hypothetical protein